MGNPMYRQIAEQLRLRIESGELAPGSQLPTELVLREEFNASRNTVRDAIKWLTNLGLVDTRPGQGTFVAEAIDPFVTTLSGDRTGDWAAARVPATCRRSASRTGNPQSARSRSRSSRLPTISPPGCWFPRAPRSSAGTNDASLTAPPGRCRRPSTRWSSPTGELSGSAALETSTKEPCSTFARRCTSARSVSRLDYRTHTERERSGLFSRFPRMAGFRCTRYSGLHSTGTGNRCA